MKNEDTGPAQLPRQTSRPGRLRVTLFRLEAATLRATAALY
jgi:hypothetical protein